MARRGFKDNTEFHSAALADIMARAKALEMAQQASEAKSGGALIVEGQPVFENPDPMIEVIDKNTGEKILVNASTLDNMTMKEDSLAKSYRLTPGQGFSAPREAVVQHAIDRGILPGDEIIAEQILDQVERKPTLIETLRTIQPGNVEPRGISGGGVSRTVPIIENPIPEESILENVLRGNNPGLGEMVALEDAPMLSYPAELEEIDAASRTGAPAALYGNESIKTGRTPSVMEGKSDNLWEWLLKMTTPAVGNVVEEAPPTILKNVVSANAEDIPVTQDTILARLNDAINEGDKIDAIRQRPGALFVNEMNRRARQKASNRATGNLNELYLQGLKKIRDRGLEDTRDSLLQDKYGLNMDEFRREPPTMNAVPRNPAAIYDIESLQPRLTPQQEGEQRILDILREQAIQNIQEDAVNAGGVPPMPPGGIDDIADGPEPGNWAGRMLGDNRVRLGLAGLGAAGLTALIANAVAQDQERKRQAAANSLNYPMEY